MAGTFPFAEGEISLTDKDGDTVDLFYVDEIRLKRFLMSFNEEYAKKRSNRA